MSILVCPSLLAADFSCLADEIRAIEQAGADWLHLDVMDGHFVPNISFGAPVIAKLRSHTRLPFDVHLMIAPVDPFLEAFAAAGADHLLVHVEAGPHTHRSLQRIRQLGKQPGIVLCPATPAEHARHVLDLVDIVLLMTVNPGFGGQQFLDGQLGKVAEMRAMIDATGRDIRLQVDGGIDAETAARARQAGADTLVAGSSIFNDEDYATSITGLRGA